MIEGEDDQPNIIGWYGPGWGGPFASNDARKNDIDKDWVFSEYGEPNGPYNPTDFAAKMGATGFAHSLSPVKGTLFGEDKDIYIKRKTIEYELNSEQDVERILEEEPSDEEVEELLEPGSWEDSARAYFWDKTGDAISYSAVGTAAIGGVGVPIGAIWSAEEAFDATSNYLESGLVETGLAATSGAATGSAAAILGLSATLFTLARLQVPRAMKAYSKAEDIRTEMSIEETLDYMEEENYDIYVHSTRAILDLEQAEGFSRDLEDDELVELL